MPRMAPCRVQCQLKGKILSFNPHPSLTSAGIASKDSIFLGVGGHGPDDSDTCKASDRSFLQVFVHSASWREGEKGEAVLVV